MFDYSCGKCKSINFKKLGISSFKHCAECNNGPLCNTETFFESQLFCWEKILTKWKPEKGKMVCEKNKCFIGVDKNKMGENKLKEFNFYLNNFSIFFIDLY